MMNVTRLLALLVLALGITVAAGCGGSDESVPDNAVAVVNGEEITRSDLDDLMVLAKTSYQSQKREFPKAGTPEYQSLQNQAVAFLVQRVEYKQKAADLGVEVTDKDVDARIDQVRKESFGGDETKLQGQIKQQGYTQDTFRDAVESDLLADRIYDDVTKGIKVPAAEAKKYYDQNKSTYEVPESRDVRHILVKKKERADEIYDELKAGADFATLAKRYSLDTGSKEDGGKLTITRGQTVGPFDTTAFLLPAGSISRPVKTEFGYHVIQALSGVKPAQTTPFAQVQASISKQLLDDKKSKAVTTWLASVQKEYDGKVSYADGFAPPELQSTGSDAGTATNG
jgi:foldase protein PrsA